MRVRQDNCKSISVCDMRKLIYCNRFVGFKITMSTMNILNEINFLFYFIGYSTYEKLKCN